MGEKKCGCEKDGVNGQSACRGAEEYKSTGKPGWGGSREAGGREAFTISISGIDDNACCEERRPEAESGGC
jgi:hypothetical protein